MTLEVITDSIDDLSTILLTMLHTIDHFELRNIFKKRGRGGRQVREKIPSAKTKCC